MSKKFIAALALLLALCSFLSACSGKSDRDDKSEVKTTYSDEYKWFFEAYYDQIYEDTYATAYEDAYCDICGDYPDIDFPGRQGDRSDLYEYFYMTYYDEIYSQIYEIAYEDAYADIEKKKRGRSFQFFLIIAFLALFIYLIYWVIPVIYHRIVRHFRMKARRKMYPWEK